METILGADRFRSAMPDTPDHVPISSLTGVAGAPGPAGGTSRRAARTRTEIQWRHHPTGGPSLTQGAPERSQTTSISLEAESALAPKNVTVNVQNP